jgi:hypothetical protein
MRDENPEAGVPPHTPRPSPLVPRASPVVPPSPVRSRRWIWYFVVLAALGTAAIAINFIYNVLQQLKPEQLAAARALWEEKAPPDYDLDYVVKDEEATGGTEPLHLLVERISVHVRAGEVQSVSRNATDVPAAERGSYGVVPLFDLIQADLEKDGQPGAQRTFTHALFDKTDGHPIHYVRRVLGTRRRLEIIIQLTDPSDPSPKAPLLPN